MDEKAKKKKLWLIPLLLCLLIAGGVVVYVLADIGRTQKEMDEYRRLQAAAAATPTMEAFRPTPTPVPEPTEAEATPTAVPTPPVEIPEKNLDWAALHEENADIYAWLYVPDVGIDYPVVQNENDDTYYLNHNLDGSTGAPACIFSEKSYNSKDFSDPNTVLYGHNYDDGTMFSSLHDFEDGRFMKEDHYIFIYREDGDPLVYQVFAGYETNAMHLLANYDLSNSYAYAQYLRSIFYATGRVAHYRYDIVPDSRDRIITLSTCTTDHDRTRRFLVQGILLDGTKRADVPDIRL